MLTATLPFGDLIKEDELARYCEGSSVKRRRIYTPEVTLRAFLSQAVGKSRSCQEAVNHVHLSSYDALNGSCSLNTSSYSRARTRLNIGALKKLTKEVNDSMTIDADPRWLWKKRKVSILDGSTIAMADTSLNTEVFPKKKNQQTNGYPLSRVMIASSLETGGIIDFKMAAFKGKGTGEIPLGASLLSSLESGNVLLADAMFTSFAFIGLCLNQGLDLLAPLKSNRKFVILGRKNIDDGDRLIVIEKPKLPHTGWISQSDYDQIPDKITLRETVISIQRNGFRSKSIKIITTMLDSETYSKQDLTEIFWSRWNIELDLRIIKRDLGINFITAKSPEMVSKEIWINLLAFNLVRRLINITSKRNGKCPRNISFKKTLDYYLKSYQISPFKLERMPTKISEALSKFEIFRQVGRNEPRARKTSYGSDYPKLTISRSQWRLVKIMPELEGLEFSSAFLDGFKKVKERMPTKKGYSIY